MGCPLDHPGLESGRRLLPLTLQSPAPVQAMLSINVIKERAKRTAQSHKELYGNWRLGKIPPAMHHMHQTKLRLEMQLANCPLGRPGSESERRLPALTPQAPAQTEAILTVSVARQSAKRTAQSNKELYAHNSDRFMPAVHEMPQTDCTQRPQHHKMFGQQCCFPADLIFAV